MSLLTPERVPVKVYRWDDAGAPALDKTAGCMANIFKACLVTGYGTKEGAGWTMPWEDTAAGIKVLRPEVGPHTDFYLRCSGDTGKEMVAKIYQNMTDINTGDLKMQLATAFKFGGGLVSGKWILIASPYGFWFLSEHRRFTSIDEYKSGAYFTVGNVRPTASGGGVYLQHSGGTDSTGNHAGLFPVSEISSLFAYGAFLSSSGLVVNGLKVLSAANGKSAVTTADYNADIYIIVDGEMYILPAVYSPFSGAAHNNFEQLTAIGGGDNSKVVVFGTSAQEVSNIYISTDTWVY